MEPPSISGRTVYLFGELTISLSLRDIYGIPISGPIFITNLSSFIKKSTETASLSNSTIIIKSMLKFIAFVIASIL